MELSPEMESSMKRIQVTLSDVIKEVNIPDTLSSAKQDCEWSDAD